MLVERKASLFKKISQGGERKEKPKVKDMHNTTFKQQALEELKQLKIGYDRVQSLAYLAYIMPGNYGPSFRIFSEIKKILKEKYFPSSVLDFGTGPGTAIWFDLLK